jgi:hypothetical protein
MTGSHNRSGCIILVSRPTMLLLTIVVIATGALTTATPAIAQQQQDPFNMNQDVLFAFATDCLTAIGTPGGQSDKVACCKAVEMSHDLIDSGFVTRDLYAQAQTLGELMEPYEGPGTYDVGNIGYYGCVQGGVTEQNFQAVILQ